MIGVIGSSVSKGVTEIASRQLGDPMVKDEYGNINILVTGYAWAQERGGLLMDTIMLMSYNPNLGTVTFLSIPRDLYVAYSPARGGKINGLFWAWYLEWDNSFASWAVALSEKVEEITGVSVPYYVMVNFEGFVDFIDMLEWVQVDVPYTLHDELYPAANNGYQTFHIEQGLQQLDGETALKYARSRQTTSDFSRALRQQHIIEAVIEKITDMLASAQIGKLQDLFEQTKNVYTSNITYKQMLGMTEYLDDERWYFSFVYTANCDLRYLDLIEPGCFLRYGNRDAFGWAAVLIPEGARPSNLTYYNKTQDFAFWVVHNQEFLKESAEIRVLNGINLDEARAQGYKITGVATDLGRELLLRWFDIERVTNAPTDHATTKIAVPWTGSYVDTIDALASFVDYDEVIVDSSYGSWGVSIILGNDYLKNL